MQCHKALQVSHTKSSYRSHKENNSQNNYIGVQSTLSVRNAEHKSWRQIWTCSAACWNAAQGVGKHRVGKHTTAFSIVPNHFWPCNHSNSPKADCCSKNAALGNSALCYNLWSNEQNRLNKLSRRGRTLHQGKQYHGFSWCTEHLQCIRKQKVPAWRFV